MQRMIHRTHKHKHEHEHEHAQRQRKHVPVKEWVPDDQGARLTKMGAKNAKTTAAGRWSGHPTEDTNAPADKSGFAYFTSPAYLSLERALRTARNAPLHVPQYSIMLKALHGEQYACSTFANMPPQI